MDQLLILLGIVGLAVGLVALAYTFFQSRRVSTSVKTVTNAARQVAEGHFDSPVNAPASAATRELASAFNSMSASLASTLQESSGEQNKLSVVLATMADGVIVVEGEGTVLLVNPAAQTMLGLEEDQLTGKRLVEVVRDNTIHQLISDCLATEQPQLEIVELLRPRKHLSVAATTVEFGGAREVLLTLHDLTESRQAEISQKEFVSNVSHELRNPLASVKAMVETLEDGAIDQTAVARDFLERIRSDIDRMNNLVNDLLELSRLESGQLNLETTSVDLTDLITEVVAGLDAAARHRGITLTAQAPEELPAVTADADRIKQVLINLVENALRFTGPDGEVKLGATAQAGSVKVTVKDTGVGISSQHLPHIFQRFYKVDRSRGDGGTGLGLAIVKQIIEAHGGEVRAESVEGEGSTFEFTLPTA